MGIVTYKIVALDKDGNKDHDTSSRFTSLEKAQRSLAAYKMFCQKTGCSYKIERT